MRDFYSLGYKNIKKQVLIWFLVSQVDTLVKFNLLKKVRPKAK